MTDATYDNVIISEKLRSRCDLENSATISGYQLLADIQPGNVGGSTGYTSAPTVTFSGGGGTGATATATISNGAVTGINVTNGGSGYSSAPYVAISGPGSGASLSASISGGQVSAVNIGNQGSGYTANSIITFTGGGGYGATATASIQGSVAFVPITEGGFGYTSAPTVTFSGGGGTGATATATISNGAVTGITITNQGSGYTDSPTVTISGGNGTGATATATILGSIISTSVTNGGSGYTSTPSVTISDIPATATAFVDSGQVVSVNVTSRMHEGASTIKLLDTHSGNYVNLFLNIRSEDGSPLLATDQGFVVKKDFQAGGFLSSGQGAIFLDHGLNGYPIASSPPCIELSDSTIQYPSGATFPNNPQTGQLFNLNTAYTWSGSTWNAGNYMWNGSTWITGNFSGQYDTLFLFKGDGITLADLTVGTLNATSTNIGTLNASTINIPARTTDPQSPTTGSVWLRSDL